MGHAEWEMVFYGIGRTLQAASPAVPAFGRIKYRRLLPLIRPGENVSWADLITVATIDTFVIDHGRHTPLAPVMSSLYGDVSPGCPRE
jgi:hypothetical protein